MKTPIQLEIDVGYTKLEFALNITTEQLVLMRGTNTKMYHLIKMARNEAQKIYKGIQFHNARLYELERQLADLDDRLDDWGWEN